MDKKRVLKICDVKHIIVPRLDELSIKHMIEMIRGDAALAMYFPDEFLKGRIPDRTFFFNVLNTIYPGYLNELIGHANK